MRGKIQKTVKMAGDSDEFQTGYYTNTNLEYSVYILIPVLNEIREESRTNTEWPKVYVCVVSPSVVVSTGNC